MVWVIVSVVFALIAAIGAIAFWRYRKRRQIRLISFVGLLSEPVSYDPAVLAHVAGRAWNADLGDGASEGPDGFVAGNEIFTMIMHDGRMFLINCVPGPYSQDVDKEAESLADLRCRSLFRQHRAWFSCDAFGVDGTVSEEETLEWYRRLGKLFSEFLDENCLLLYLPDSHLVFPINDDTRMALRSPNPLRALQELSTVPIIEVADPKLLEQSIEKARQEWPRFVAAFETSAGDHFAIKAPISHGENTEFIWIEVTSLEGERVYGELANEPGDLGPLKLGSKVSVPLTDINDWCFQDGKGNLIGGFSIEAIQKAAQQKRLKS